MATYRIRLAIAIFAIMAANATSIAGKLPEGEALRLCCQRMSDTFDYPGLRQKAERLHRLAKKLKDKRLEAYANFYLAASELKTGPVEKRQNICARGRLIGIAHTQRHNKVVGP